MEQVRILTKDVRVVIRKGNEAHIVYHNTDQESFRQNFKEERLTINQVQKTNFPRWKNLIKGFPK